MAEDQDVRQAQRDRFVASSQHTFPGPSQNAPPPTWGELLEMATGGRRAVRPSGEGRIIRPSPPASPPPLSVWPSEETEEERSRRSDPTNQKPLRHPILLHWIVVYDALGRMALQESFYDFARRAYDGSFARSLRSPITLGKSRTSFELLLRDEKEKTNHVASLLAMLPDKIIMALLRGELPGQYKEDKEVRDFVDKHMEPRELPGIYVNLLSNDDGHWLSSQDMETLIEKVERYIDVDPSGKPRPDQVAVDKRHSNWTPAPNESKLRWLPSSRENRAETIIREWIGQVKILYCTNPVDPTAAFRIGPSEVGWASNSKVRCKQHMNNSSTTYIFGLLNAICRTPKPIGFSFPEPKQFVLFPIWERNEMLCKVGEVVGSLLCSSYWFLGGLNCVQAGGMTWDEEDGTKEISKLRPISSENLRWSDNVVLANERLRSIRPIQEEEAKAQRVDDLRAITERIKAAEAELEDVNLKLKDARDKCESVEAKVKAALPSPHVDAKLQAELALDDMLREAREEKDRWIKDVLLKD
ncbi:MAG: hypothetical protein Q9195_003723 [Heterodermia aff. obscurata]